MSERLTEVPEVAVPRDYDAYIAVVRAVASGAHPPRFDPETVGTLIAVIDHYRSLLREADSVLSGVLNMHIAHHNARQHAAARALLSRINEALGEG